MIINLLIGILGAGIGSGLMVIVQMILQRKWQKEDRTDARVAALKLLMIDRARSLAQTYLNRGYISLEEKEDILEMHTVYKSLGGDGHLDVIMDEIRALEVK